MAVSGQGRGISAIRLGLADVGDALPAHCGGVAAVHECTEGDKLNATDDSVAAER